MSIKIEVLWGPEPEGKFITLPLASGRFQKILFDRSLPKVLIVGEGKNFTFTAAFVALRRSFENVITTTWPVLSPDWSEVVKTALSNAHRNQEFLAKSDLYDTTSFTVEEVYTRYGSIFGVSPSTGPTYIGNVNATELEEHDNIIHSHCENIFFQCPHDGQSGTQHLIVSFMSSAARVQKAGNYLFLGITKDGRYSNVYGLRELIETSAPNIGYRLEGVDDITIQKILHFGYRHQARRDEDDIHDRILAHHVTLVFHREDSSSSPVNANDLSDEFASRLNIREPQRRTGIEYSDDEG
ncbi:uncharacterized protein SPPG_02428 [Spizellomyces punctatus DAOM BR117]|uniref:25S rRNA (uridine-N(3))-methyltransferase BMT5-like domain-containing protein n=1 Tax=Spizellomyces punctatus (strain DAOM BR117) TaxID=645134 RepID=A0A0L0HLX7_SPIPD|nr:uncharacterized protein SPPG_02428 [Spizellomyces punctatus DAOM BR117]KND01920.1 hypothetical protein SPPG_02428 [Spizellomyces punctatus DAOM BR117]|eukprot:XP_016609959.1 hypothetical protein SPPG_02428 [Spizellomyces punctatus DAOM BR117]